MRQVNLLYQEDKETFNLISEKVKLHLDFCYRREQWERWKFLVRKSIAEKNTVKRRY